MTEAHIEELESRIEALLRANPETGEQWADICAMEAVIIDWRAAQ